MVKNAVRAVVYVPTATRAEWVERELSHDDIMVQVARGVTDIIAAVVDDPPPRPQILVVDFESLDMGEILELHSIRDRGWTGTVFALGQVPIGIRKSLRIERVLPTLVDNTLRIAVTEIGFDNKTRRLPVISAIDPASPMPRKRTP